jgi:hypothetical protein
MITKTATGIARFIAVSVVTILVPQLRPCELSGWLTPLAQRKISFAAGVVHPFAVAPGAAQEGTLWRAFRPAGFAGNPFRQVDHAIQDAKQPCLRRPS